MAGNNDADVALQLLWWQVLRLQITVLPKEQ